MGVSKCTSVDGLMWSIHTVEDYSARKTKGVLVPPTTQINLEDITLCEISQLPKDSYCMIPVCEVSKAIKFIETESRMVVARGWGRRNRKLLSGYRVLVPKVEKFRT